MQTRPILKSIALIFLVVVGVFIYGLGPIAKAYAETPYYKGKTIKIMVPEEHTTKWPGCSHNLHHESYLETQPWSSKIVQGEAV